MERGRCAQHAKQQRRVEDERRGSATERGYDYRWRRYARWFLRLHPLCYYCHLRGDVTPATCVDHATPPSSADDPLFWESSNHRPACIACNSAKGHRTEAEYLASCNTVSQRHQAATIAVLSKRQRSH